MTIPAKIIRVPDERVYRLLEELQFALGRLPAGEIAILLTAMPVNDFVQAVWRRGVNLTSIVKAVAEFAYDETALAVEACRQDRFANHFAEKSQRAVGWGREKVEQGGKQIAALRDDPTAEGLKLVAVALAALASSGGVDGNGGLPDLDIPLMGIGAHRSPFTHSILIGAGAEALIAVLIRTVLAIHDKLPTEHDPVWDEFSKHAAELLDAVLRGVSIGVAYHLLVDGLAQPASYHGLPISLPLQVHQGLLVTNGMAEGLYGVRRPDIRPKTPELVGKHRRALSQPFEVEPTLIEWLGPEKTLLLERQGVWMCALTTGELTPISESQVHFVQVAWQLDAAQTPAEVAWVWFINVLRIARGVDRANSSGAAKLMQWFANLR